MDKTMQDFLRNAKRLGLCDEYTAKWHAAKSKKQLIDIALDANGLSFVANAVAKGYLSAEYICEAFAPFNNGKYIRSMDGYTSAMYCSDGKSGCITEITAATTALLVIGFNGVITIPLNRICEVYLVDSQCLLKGYGSCHVYAYGETKVYNREELSIKVMAQ